MSTAKEVSYLIKKGKWFSKHSTCCSIVKKKTPKNNTYSTVLIICILVCGYNTLTDYFEHKTPGRFPWNHIFFLSCQYNASSTFSMIYVLFIEYARKQKSVGCIPNKLILTAHFLHLSVTWSNIIHIFTVYVLLLCILWASQVNDFHLY